MALRSLYQSVLMLVQPPLALCTSLTLALAPNQIRHGCSVGTDDFVMFAVLDPNECKSKHVSASSKCVPSPAAVLGSATITAASQTFLCTAGPLYNNEGVLLHVGATIIWSDGRRANFQCGFDQALTQYLEVR